MNLPAVVVLYCALFYSVCSGTINHDQVQPIAQPEPVTISEKAAVKYKPQLFIEAGCASFPAVNAAGEITGGLKGTKGTDRCENAPLGSQVYGRSSWYQDRWAMVYAWYFPKNFGGGQAKKRHDWASMVLWIDNPAVETPKILGASLSQQTLDAPKVGFLSLGERKKESYQKMIQLPPMAFVGGSNISTRVSHAYPDKFGWIASVFSNQDGTYHDLIMWEQLTDAARGALNSADFGEAKVPFNDNNFDATLGEAWPL
ncbi:Necrosis inducing protein NPP1 [Phytophthora megakarya]|uniref:Necrosis inducing protein NPP1 n=1 Tax=Phytophthora megakarya TaxID=4795 RepID=A0A225UQ63_9STRA|nr:Necrosis inducing protein NPP1 [Phytophthora megakarya]